MMKLLKLLCFFDLNKLLIVLIWIIGSMDFKFYVFLDEFMVMIIRLCNFMENIDLFFILL